MTNGSNAKAALCYIPPLFIIGVVNAKKDGLQRFHAGQGIALFLVGTAMVVCANTASFFLSALPMVGMPTAFLIRASAWGVWMYSAARGIIWALRGEERELWLTRGIKLL